MARKFGSPAQFRGTELKAALISNWRALVTHINAWIPSFDDDGSTLTLPGDLYAAGTVSGATPTADTHLATKAYVDAYRLIHASTVTDTTDVTNVPATAAGTTVKTWTITGLPASTLVLVDCFIKVRWKGGTAGEHVWVRAEIGGADVGLVSIDDFDTYSAATLMQYDRATREVTTNGSGQTTVGIQARSEGGDADIEEMHAAYLVYTV